MPIKIADNIHQVRAVGSRVTVIRRGGKVMLVDAGAKGSVGFIRSGLDLLGIATGDVLLVAVTHHHPDHVGGLHSLVKATGAKVAAHRLDAPVISGAIPPPNPVQRNYVSRLAGPALRRTNGRAVPVDYALEDGGTLPGFGGVVAVHAPGHTPGSICLYLPEEKAIIVGDALQHQFGRRLSPPRAMFTEDMPTARQSLSNLLALDFDTIVFSHFPPVRTGGREAMRRLVGE